MMIPFLYLFALLEVGYGVGGFAGAQITMQESFVIIGFGIMTAGLAAILMEVAKSRELLQRLVTAAQA
jgi:hypothetical protein